MKLHLTQLLLIIFCCSLSAQKKKQTPLKVKKTQTSIDIDGIGDDNVWYKTEWQPIDQVWEGKKVKEDDFTGRYKMTWDDTALYILVETTDEKTLDITRDPLIDYYKDDSLIVFVDEDNSGGDHLDNFNAFAYHVSLSGDVVDLNKDRQARRFNHHIKSVRRQDGNKSVWEMKLYVFKGNYKERKENRPVKLKANKKIGFAIGYNDLDIGQERDNLMGSVYIPGKDKNTAYKDANVFGTILLIE